MQKPFHIYACLTWKQYPFMMSLSDNFMYVLWLYFSMKNHLTWLLIVVSLGHLECLPRKIGKTKITVTILWCYCFIYLVIHFFNCYFIIVNILKKGLVPKSTYICCSFFILQNKISSLGMSLIFRFLYMFVFLCIIITLVIKMNDIKAC